MSNRKPTKSRSAASKKSYSGGAKKSFSGGKTKFGSKPAAGKKSWGDKPERKFSSRPSSGEDKKPWGDKPDRKAGFKPAGRKTSWGDKPERKYSSRTSSGEDKKPWGDKPDRKAGFKPAGRKTSWGDKPERKYSSRTTSGEDKKPWGDKPDRKAGFKPAGRKTSWGDKPERKYSSRTSSGEDKKPWGDKPDRKVGYKSAGRKTSWSDKPPRRDEPNDDGVSKSWEERKDTGSPEKGYSRARTKSGEESDDSRSRGRNSDASTGVRSRAGSTYKGRKTDDERPRRPRIEKKSTVDKVNERYAEKKKSREEDGGSKERPAFRKDKKEYTKRDTAKRGYQKSYEKKRKEQPDIMESFEGEIRLNRYLSNAGICSRREADELITAGLVSVNGVIISELGTKVKPGDDIRFNDERLSTERKVYLIMNKPKDTITTLDDPDKRRIVTDLIIGHQLPRVYPVGRLDRNTTGVLILTNDGELSQRLMHPKYGVQKVYKATLNKNFKGEDLWKLANGVELEDGFIKPDAVLMPDPAHKNEVLVELHSGKNRIVHRMFESIGYSLDKLDRVVYAGFNKKALSRGEWRELNDREIKQLKKLVQL